MGWGDPSFNEWGGPEWGSEFNPLQLEVMVDVLATAGDVEAAFDADVLAVLLGVPAWDADVIAQATQEDRFEADVFVSRLPTDKLEKRYTKPVLLVDMDLPSGRLRVSGRDTVAAGYAWAGYLQNAGEIERSVGARLDDLRIAIADPGGTIAAGFSESDPPESAPVIVYLLALDDDDRNLFKIFDGRIDQIVGVAPGLIEIEVVRSDAVKDRILGRLLTDAIEADAPDESLGKMIPHVYGAVKDHEGLVSAFNAISQTNGPLLATTTSIVLADASRFSSSGQAILDEEEISWTSTFRNELLGVTRGINGTEASPHPPGVRVVEIGPFEVLFADHAVTQIDTVRFLDGDGNEAIPIPSPSIDVAEAKARWSRTPEIIVPSRAVDLVTFGFDTEGPSNTAQDPLNAARESIGFTDLNYAEIDPGEVLQLERVVPVEPEGEITRVGIAVAFDPDSVGARLRIDGQTVGFLQALDNVPAWALRRLERHFRTTYDVRDPQHSHSQSISIHRIRPEIRITPEGVVWFNIDGAYDSNAATFANYGDLTGNRELLVLRGGDVSLGAGESIVSAQLKAWAGGNLMASCDIQVMRPGNIVLMNIRTPGALDTPTFFESSIVSNNIPTPFEWKNTDWVVRPLGSAGSTYRIRDMYVDLGISRGINTAPTNVAQRRSFVNFFDLTDQVQSDWDWFGDTSKGARIQIDNAPATTRINTAMYVVEVRPKNRTFVEVPRVFAQVRGIEPAGRPTKIAEKVITQAKPLGLGLPLSTITQGSYAIARQSLAADSIELDFAVKQRTSGLNLLRRIAEQADLRQSWNAGLHVLKRKPNPASLPDVFKTFRDDDILRGTLSRSRQSIGEVVNRWETSYRFSDRVGDFTRVHEEEDAGSQVKFGEQSGSMDLELVRANATADAVTSARLERSKDPRWVVGFLLPLAGLDLRQGDLIALEHKQFSFSKAEVLGLSIVNQSGLAVRVQAVVWEE